MTSRLLVVLLAMPVAGCYLFHGGDGAGEEPADAGPSLGRDAGSARDAGASTTGTRPSDLPEADDWEDPPPEPPVGPADPCCELGETVVIDDVHTNGGEPAVGWHGTGWGILWSAAPDGWFYRWLSRDTSGLGPIVSLGGGSPFDGDAFAPGALAWFDGRYAVVAAAFNEMSWEGRLLGTWSTTDSAVRDIAYYPGAGLWLGVSVSMGAVAIQAMRSPDGGAEGRVLFDRSRHDPRIVTLSSRAVLVSRDRGTLLQRGFVWPYEEIGPELRVASLSLTGDALIDAVRLRDHVVVSAMDGSDVWITVTDPWEGRIVAGPVSVAASNIGDRRAGLAAFDKRSQIGVCIPTGPGPHGGAAGHDDGVSFQLVGPDGRPWGSPVVVADGLANIGGCAVGHDGEQFAVAWWRAAADGPTLWARLVRPVL